MESTWGLPSVRPYRLLIAVFVVVVLLAAAGVQATDLQSAIQSKFKTVISLTVFAFFFCHITFVYGLARLFELQGGLFAAVIGDIVGFVLGILLAIPAAFAVMMLPQSVGAAISGGAAMIGGAVGIRWTFNSDFGYAFMVYVLASTGSMLVLIAGLLVAF